MIMPAHCCTFNYMNGNTIDFRQMMGINTHTHTHTQLFYCSDGNKILLICNFMQYCGLCTSISTTLIYHLTIDCDITALYAVFQVYLLIFA